MRVIVLVTALLAVACGGNEQRSTSAAGHWEFQVESTRFWQGRLSIGAPDDNGDVAGSIHIESMADASYAYDGIAGGIYSGELVILRATISGFRPFNIIAKVEGEQLRGYAMGGGFEAAPFVAQRWEAGSGKSLGPPTPDP